MATLPGPHGLAVKAKAMMSAEELELFDQHKEALTKSKALYYDHKVDIIVWQHYSDVMDSFVLSMNVKYTGVR